MSPGIGEFDVSMIEFEFNGKTQNIYQPYIYDLPEIKAGETIVIDAHIKIPVTVGYLLKGQFFTSIFLTDEKNAEVEPLPCIHTFPYDIRTGFHYTPFENQDILFVINEHI